MVTTMSCFLVRRFDATWLADSLPHPTAAHIRDMGPKSEQIVDHGGQLPAVETEVDVNVQCLVSAVA